MSFAQTAAALVVASSSAQSTSSIDRKTPFIIDCPAGIAVVPCKGVTSVNF